MAGSSHSRDHRSFATVAGDLPSRSHFSMYSSATSPNVVPTAILRHDALPALGGGGIVATGDGFAGSVTQLAGRAQRQVGIAAERQLLFEAVDAVLEPPEPTAGRRDQEIKAPTVGQLVFPVCGASRSSLRYR